MLQYVNEEAFFTWYDSVALAKSYNRSILLNDVYQQYAETKDSVFVLPADMTSTGKEESYSYRIEDIGKCGASTVFMYF